jgi:hypothetical protein
MDHVPLVQHVSGINIFSFDGRCSFVKSEFLIGLR